MKKLALLFLVLPLPAYAASDAGQLRLHQAAEARTVCEAKNEGPSSSRYGACVNYYLQTHYGWQVARRRDGSLGVATFTHGVPQSY